MTPDIVEVPIAAVTEVELEVRDFEHEHQLEERLYLLNDNGQFDWVIPLMGTLEKQYISILTTHSGYWDNKDFARMVAIECVRCSTTGKRPCHCSIWCWKEDLNKGSQDRIEANCIEDGIDLLYTVVIYVKFEAI